jgi:hypothetical protein
VRIFSYCWLYEREFGGEVVVLERCRLVGSGEIGGGRFDFLQVGCHLLERVEDSAGVGELDAVVGDGLNDNGKDVDELFKVGGIGMENSRRAMRQALRVSRRGRRLG